MLTVGSIPSVDGIVAVAASSVEASRSLDAGSILLLFLDKALGKEQIISSGTWTRVPCSSDEKISQGRSDLRMSHAMRVRVLFLIKIQMTLLLLFLSIIVIFETFKFINRLGTPGTTWTCPCLPGQRTCLRYVLLILQPAGMEPLSCERQISTLSAAVVKYNFFQIRTFLVGHFERHAVLRGGQRRPPKQNLRHQRFVALKVFFKEIGKTIYVEEVAYPVREPFQIYFLQILIVNC